MKFIFSFDKNKFLRPVEITRRHSMVFLFCQDTGVFFCETDVGSGGWRKQHCENNATWWQMMGRGRGRVRGWGRLSSATASASASVYGFFVCATDVGFGGWENIWEIMYHSANVTKYVGLEPLCPSSIIVLPFYYFSSFYYILAIGLYRANMPLDEECMCIHRSSAFV